MEFIFFIEGIIIGVIIALILKRKGKIYGVIEVDHNTEMCKFRITSEELSNYKTKKAVFKIEHNAQISREEQGL